MDRERLYRDNTRRTRLLQQAHLKVAQACLEDLDYKAARGLDKRQIAALASREWVRRGQNVLITGPTESGKTWLACALAQHACREGLSALYWRVPRLFEELRVAHGDGSYMRLLKRIEKASILVVDDWGLTALGAVQPNSTCPRMRAPAATVSEPALTSPFTAPESISSTRSAPRMLPFSSPATTTDLACTCPVTVALASIVRLPWTLISPLKRPTMRTLPLPSILPSIVRSGAIRDSHDSSDARAERAGLGSGWAAPLPA